MGRFITSASLFVLLVLAGCQNLPDLQAREKGALGGGALGAGLGAIVGNQAGNTGAGIAIGSAFGALTGALIGNQIDNSDAALADQNSRLAERDRQIEENRRLIEELRGRGLDVHDSARGVVVNLPDVFFEFDRSNLTRSAESTVAEIAQTLNKAGERRITVEGHTDSIGTVAYNQRLSQDRADSVAGALTSNGLPRRLITTRGFGERDPVASNSTDAGRAKNRRVEVIIERR